MIESRDDQFLFVEKYRPQKIDDCILPDALKKTIKDVIAQGEIPNMLFTGTAGVGKTTVAKAIAKELDADLLYINASLDTSIDMLRTTIAQYASTISLHGGKKIVLLDEADHSNPQHFQPALRGFIEEFSSNCRFILTCNFKNRILEPIHSRCTVIDFKIDSKEKQQIAAQFFKRVTQILKQEQIEFDPKVVAELITKHFPDYRRILNELQRYSVSGKIDSGILVNMSDESFKELMINMKEKNFTEVRKWVAKNSDADSTQLFRNIYDRSSDYLETKSIPQLVLILADYQHRGAFVADQELNIMAAMTEVMSSCSFK